MKILTSVKTISRSFKCRSVAKDQTGEKDLKSITNDLKQLVLPDMLINFLLILLRTFLNIRRACRTQIKFKSQLAIK